MLRSIEELFGYKIHATNGEMGKVHDFYFDDESWTARYMVADTGNWLTDRKVLISPITLDQPDWKGQIFTVNINKEQIEAGPEIDIHKPVSRQKELELSRHFRWPAYWTLTEVSGPQEAEVIMRSIEQAEQEMRNKEEQAGAQDRHLRSAKEVMGYSIHAKDGNIGYVEDFIVDDETWDLRYLVIDTKNWLPGSKKVLISPDWVSAVEWASTEVDVDMTAEQIEGAPEFDPGEPVNKEYEVQLYDFYGRPKYWNT